MAETYFGKVLMPEKTAKKSRSKERKNEILYKSFIRGAVLCAQGFLLGRINIFNALNPVGIAFLSACADKGALFYPVCLCVFLGYATGSRFFGAYGYWVAAACCAVFTFIMEGNGGKITEKKQAVISMASVFAGGMVVSVFNGLSTFLMVRSATESIASGALTVLFARGMKTGESDLKRKILTNDEILCLSVPVIFSIASLSTVFGQGVPVRSFFGVYFLLAVSHVCGAAAGGAAAVILGFVLMMCGQADSGYLCAMAFGGIMCGIFGRKNRVTASAVFMVSAFVPLFYMGEEVMREEITASTAAALMFILTPKRFFGVLSTYSSARKEFDENKYYIKVKNCTEEKMKQLSSSFEALSAIFGKREDVQESITPKSSAVIIDTAADRVCSSCGLGVYCWKGKTLETYGAVYAMINSFEQKGAVDTADVPQPFARNCVKLKQLAEAVNSCCREFKTSEVWKRRIDDSRFIIKEQLEEMKKITEEMNEKINFRPFFDETVAKEIKERLVQKGYGVHNVTVLTEDGGKVKAIVESTDCGGKERCRNIFAREVSLSCGKTMVMTDKNCSGEFCRSIFEEENAFDCSFVHCCAVCGNGETSGDNFTAKKYKNDKFTAAVSDGMGSGERASRQSKDTLHKFSTLLSAGFDEETAVKAVNCSLSGEYDETFSTLDVLTIDLKNGKGRIIKNGGASAFIIRDGSASAVKSTSLPLGIRCRTESEVLGFDVRDKDVVLMITDGAEDALKGEDEEKLVEKMAAQTGNIKLLCSEIIKYAVEKDGGVPKDDMLALAVKIYEN